MYVITLIYVIVINNMKFTKYIACDFLRSIEFQVGQLQLVWNIYRNVLKILKTWWQKSIIILLLIKKIYKTKITFKIIICSKTRKWKIPEVHQRNHSATMITVRKSAKWNKPNEIKYCDHFMSYIVLSDMFFGGL